MSVLRRAYVEVEPDVSGFDEKLREKFSKQDPGGKAGKQLGGQINRALKKLDLDPIDIKADPKSAFKALEETERKLLALSRNASTVEIKVHAERGLSEIGRFRKQLGDAGDDGALGFFGKFQARLGPLMAGLPISGPMSQAVAAAAGVAAPLVGAAISGAIIGGVGVGGVAGGLLVASKDFRVQAAANTLGARLENRLEKAGGAFVEPAIHGLATIETALESIDLNSIFTSASRFVGPLADDVSKAITALGDGVESLVSKAGPAVASIGDGIALIGLKIGEGLALLSSNGQDGADALDLIFKLVASGIQSVFILTKVLTEVYSWIHKIGADAGLLIFLKLTGVSMDKTAGSADSVSAAMSATALSLDEVKKKSEDAKAAIDPLYKAQEALAAKLAIADAAARGETAALKGLSDQLRSQIDPAFALITAQGALKTAQDKSAEAIRVHGYNSIQAREATRNLAAAALDLQGKAGALAAGFSGKLTPQMLATYRAAGLTELQIRDVEFQLINAKKAADRYSGKYKAEVTAEGVPAVAGKLNALSELQSALKRGANPPARLRRYLGDSFDTGGFTGRGDKYDVAGLVHRKEFVLRSEATEKLRKQHPGALEEMNATGQMPGYARGGFVGWPFPVNVSKTRIPSAAEASNAVVPQFGDWPSSPSAQRGDSGVWRKVVALINSTGPLSGAFGNAYRAGDPLWHGSGRAVDWMGFNQDPLARFLAAKRPLELIHRTPTRDYAYTRGVNQGSFDNGLMEEHRNHIHIAMDDGGFRTLQPGMNLIPNNTGKPELIGGPAALASAGDVHIHIHDSVIASERQAVDLVARAYKQAKYERKIP